MPRQAVRIPTTLAEIPNAPQPQKRILVVDCERVVADTLVLIMQQHGYAARACYSGDEAIEQARSFTPDLLIAECEMPFRDGVETALELQTEQPACHILFLSAFANFASLAESLWSQKVEFSWINKPVSPHVLLARVDDMLEIRN